MRLLHLTDTHLGAWWSVQGAPGDWSRAQDHQDALDRVLALADNLDVDGIIHTGDVFDRSRPPARWVQAAARSLSRAARRRPVVVLAGNHDRNGIRRCLPLHVPNLHLVDRACQVRLGALRVGCVPYMRSAEGFVATAKRAVAGGVDLLLAHQAFDGVVVPGLTFRVHRQRDTVGAQHLPSGVPIVACGHIHPRQVVRCGGVPVVHPGSLSHTSFRDRMHPNGVALWTFDHDVSWRFIDVLGRPMHVVSSPADLRAVHPESLVRTRDPAWRSAALARGAWVVGRARPPVAKPPGVRPEQLRLFG